ncbi:hypothetical protein [Rhodococcus sp. 14-1411-2a]|uniref:hypothetical protein n=1 Tax=Rhodococcus sp. 14-1411-2a TaxID=2023151 RepID=UPI000BD24417|nr:hypothetical protein [Rhodococcus sp. 14-1411-2a]OZF51179.1 hypothetical protein CH291_06270 [Rhodococcus sp. 14-1411-2a]
MSVDQRVDRERGELDAEADREQHPCPDRGQQPQGQSVRFQHGRHCDEQPDAQRHRNRQSKWQCGRESEPFAPDHHQPIDGRCAHESDCRQQYCRQHRNDENRLDPGVQPMQQTQRSDRQRSESRNDSQAVGQPTRVSPDTDERRDDQDDGQRE